jgi:hypothetical protein
LKKKKKGGRDGRRRLHDEELHNLYTSTNIIRLIKSRRMRWAGHIASTGKMRNVYKIVVGKSEGKRPLGRLGVDGNISEWMLKKQEVCNGCIWLRTGTCSGLLWTW